jgi:putative transposase
MPRPPRLPLSGIYHIVSRGVRNEAIFLDALDRTEFLARFGGVAAACAWRCYAYCLMSTHYHLLVETPKGNISSGMHRLNGPYARWFNSRHGFEGHLFHNRFYSVAVESDVHLLEVFRYITLNPVRAGICNHAAHWPWSSYGAFAGSTPTPSFLRVDRMLAYFGPTATSARQRFDRFLADAGPSRPPT